MTGLTIGRLASEAGVNVETIRYYQRRRLMPEPDKPNHGHRRYGVDTAKNVMQVHWIDASTGEIKRKKLSRAKFSDFFAQIHGSRVAMEEIGRAHV